jgi:dephospho-CoA kinase
MIVGLTGGIGSGKSLVAKVFELLGCALFNSDEVAKEVYFDLEVKKRVVELLGAQAYLGNAQLNKSYISSKIFSNSDLLQKLNNIIHPEVKKRFETFVAQHPNKIIIKETALLFEAKINSEVDKIIFVIAKDDLRIKRVMARDGLTEQEVINKIKSQLPQEGKIKHSDFIIYNNEEEFVIHQVLNVFSKLKNNA